MGKTRNRDVSPSVECLQKRVKRLQDHIEAKLRDSPGIAAQITQQAENPTTSPLLDDLHKLNESRSDSSIDSLIESLSDKENEEGPPGPLGLDPEGDEDSFIELNDEILELLGDHDPNKVDEFKFHPELVKRWMKILSEGLNRDTKSQLLDMYPRKGTTPRLNPEIESVVNDTVKKRDKYMALDQELCGASLSAMGEAVDMILSNDQDGIVKNDLLKLLLDSGKLMCDLFNQLTKARKAFIYPGLDKKARSLLGTASTGEFLFGSELTQRIKSVNAAQKLGLTLK